VQAHPSFDRAVQRFRALQRRGRFPGGQLVAHHQGALVLDEVAGDGWTPADAAGRASTAVTPDTPFCVWSASKPLVAMTVAVLEERGLLDVHAPIAELLPGFGVRGKERITTLDVLTHRSGLVVPELGQHWWEWDDWQKGLDRLFAATPRYPRGTLVYHPYEFGWLLAAVVEDGAPWT
jgi:CubicO group peptidase (beta-lactamase class C family)